MKVKVLATSILASSLLMTGCQTMSPQQTTGTILGGIGGGLLCALATDNAAAIAACIAAGAMAGNLIGKHLSERENESLSKDIQRSLNSNPSSGTAQWNSPERSDVRAKIEYGELVHASDSDLFNRLAAFEGVNISAADRQKLSRLDSSTVCRPTRTSLSVEDRNITDGEIWCRTDNGDYLPLSAIS